MTLARLNFAVPIALINTTTRHNIVRWRDAENVAPDKVFVQDFGGPVLIFEGTYTMQFANNPPPTPRYDYNQMMYRLDLDDPALKGAQTP